MRAVALIALASLAGCYASHGFDGEVDPGADVVWTLERAPASFPTWCGLRTGEWTLVHARVRLESGCEHPGPYDVEIGGDGIVELTFYRWRQHGVPCAPASSLFDRFVVIEHDPGLERLAVSDTTSGAMTALPRSVPILCDDGPRQSRGGPCEHDCECSSGLRCVPFVGAAECMGSCEVPCDVDLDCSRVEVCRAGARGGLCAREDCGALGPRECGAALECLCGGPPSACGCDYREVPPPGIACRSDADCAPPLSCVRDLSGDARCALRCEKPGMRCPDGMRCARPPMPLDGWVCTGRA